MLYLAPKKYYDENGQLHFFKILEDFFLGNISLSQIGQIERNLQLLAPKEYMAIIKELNRKKVTH